MALPTYPYTNDPQASRIPIKGPSGTAFSDGVRFGVQRSELGNGLPGVLATPYLFWSISPAVSAANNIVTSVTPSGAATLTLTAGAGNTSVSIGGVTYVALDTARCISIVAANTVTARTFTVWGLDQWMQPMVEAITGPTSTTAVVGKKAFKYIQQINISGSQAAAITVGTSNKFGFPYYVANTSSILTMMGGVLLLPGVNATATTNAGSLTFSTTGIAVTAAIMVAGDLTTVSATTGDVRGTINLQAAITASVLTLDGALTMNCHMPVIGASNPTANSALLTTSPVVNDPSYAIDTFLYGLTQYTAALS